jgi:hypothetical protein
VLTDWVKKGTVEPSGLAVMSILTPPEGIADFIVTTSGNSGPGAAACRVPAAGDVSICSVAPPPPPPLLEGFLQAGMPALSHKAIAKLSTEVNILIVFMRSLFMIAAG